MQDLTTHTNPIQCVVKSLLCSHKRKCSLDMIFENTKRQKIPSYLEMAASTPSFLAWDTTHLQRKCPHPSAEYILLQREGNNRSMSLDNSYHCSLKWRMIQKQDKHFNVDSCDYKSIVSLDYWFYVLCPPCLSPPYTACWLVQVYRTSLSKNPAWLLAWIHAYLHTWIFTMWPFLTTLKAQP